MTAAATPLRRRLAPRPAPGSAPVSKRLSANVSAFVAFTTSPFKGVEWSISYVAFIAYIVAITTYRIPVGTEAMVIALVALPMEKRSLRFPPPAILSCVFLAWSFLGWTTTEYPEVVFDTLVEFAKVCAVVLAAVNVITTRARLRAFLVIFLFSYMLYPARGSLIGWATGGNTIDGRAIWNVTYSNPNDLAGLTLLQVSVALGMLEVEKKPWVRLLAWSGVLVLPVIIILTQSRGAFIALVAILLIGGRKIVRSPKKMLVLGGIVLVVVLLAPQRTWDRFRSVEAAVDSDQIDATSDETASSTVQRLEIWKVARTIIAENAFSGVGLGGYAAAHYIYAQRPTINPIALGRRDTHSTYLNIFAETGLPGFMLFIGILYFTLSAGYKVRRLTGKQGGPQAMQVFYLELGLYGFLIAGIWGSYGKLMPTYVHIALISVAARLLGEEWEVRKNGPTKTLRRGMKSPMPPQPMPSAQH